MKARVRDRRNEESVQLHDVVRTLEGNSKEFVVTGFRKDDGHINGRSGDLEFTGYHPEIVEVVRRNTASIAVV